MAILKGNSEIQKLDCVHMSSSVFLSNPAVALRLQEDTVMNKEAVFSVLTP